MPDDLMITSVGGSLRLPVVDSSTNSKCNALCSAISIITTTIACTPIITTTIACTQWAGSWKNG